MYKDTGCNVQGHAAAGEHKGEGYQLLHFVAHLV